MRGTEQTLHIEGLPLLDPCYHMIRFFNLSKLDQKRECWERSRNSDSLSQPVDSGLLESCRSYLAVQFGPNFSILLRYQNTSLRAVVRRGSVGWVLTKMEECRWKDDKTDYQ